VSEAVIINDPKDSIIGWGYFFVQAIERIIKPNPIPIFADVLAQK
jgi:hypothetical protein